MTGSCPEAKAITVLDLRNRDEEPRVDEMVSASLYLRQLSRAQNEHNRVRVLLDALAKEERGGASHVRIDWVRDLLENS